MVMGYPQSPKSPLTRNWLAMMEGDGFDDDVGGGGIPTPRGLPSPHRSSRRRQQPSLAPEAQTSAPIASRTSGSLWSFPSENPSEELEVVSGTAGSHFDRLSMDRRKVRFDKSVDQDEKRRKKSNRNGKNQLAVCQTKNVFEILQDLCGTYDSLNSPFAKWEEQIEKKIMGGDIPLDDNLRNSASDDSSDLSDILSLSSSQSLDDLFAEQDGWTFGRDTATSASTLSTKYRELMGNGSGKSRKERGGPITPSSSTSKKSSAFSPYSKELSISRETRSAKVDEPDRSVLANGQKILNQPERSTESPLLRIKETIFGTLGASSAPGKPSVKFKVNDENRKEIEDKFKFLEAVHTGDDELSAIGGDENGQAAAAVAARNEKVERRQSRAAWVAAPTMSGLTEDDSMRRRKKKNSPLTVLPDEEKRPRSCTTVPNVLSNRFKRNKSRRPPQTISTLPLSAMNNSSFENGKTVPCPGERDHSLYEYGSDRHAYVAYFHRGAFKASKAIRLYEHPTPPAFPTLAYEVVIQVSTSTVSETDCAVRKGEYWGSGTKNPLNLPIVPGTAFCGTVSQIDKSTSNRGGFRMGDRVTSLVRVGANSRHLCLGVDRLVRVPTGLDDAAVACLPEIYFSAFQALHIDQGGARYRKSSLGGKAILILGGATKIGRALIELALAGGSETVYATAKERLFKVVEEAGGVPLDRDPHHWYSLLAGKMDMVICVGHDDKQRKSELRYEHIQTLGRKGKMVLMSSPDESSAMDGKGVDLHTVDDQSAGMGRKLYNYNAFASWESDMKLGKRDLTHLLKLLGEGAISPKIYERLPLSKVARAQEIIQRKHLAGGFVLCEPWLKDAKIVQRSADIEGTSVVGVENSASFEI